jgi:histidyl-tRNA synthetase
MNLMMQQYINIIKRNAYYHTMNLDRISNELLKTLRSTPEEELQLVLNKIMCMSQFFKIENFDKDFNSFLNSLHQRTFTQQNTQMSSLLAELQSIYETDFLNQETRENDIIEIIKRVKNLKDFLHMRINLTEQKSYLELISPYLANYNEKGVELPG